MRRKHQMTHECDNRTVLMSKARCKPAFTLIELLVVVSIIALLVAILLPSLSNAKKQAVRLLCCTNLKQIYMGMYIYTDSHNDKLPHSAVKMDASIEVPGGAWANVSADNKIEWYWQQIIGDYVNVKRGDEGYNAYVKGYEIFYCTKYRGKAMENLWKPQWGNYGVNETYCTSAVDPRGQFTYAKMTQPAMRLLILDAGAYCVRGRYCKFPSGYFFYVPSAIIPGTDPAKASGAAITWWLQDDYESGRHDGIVNIAWGDGHVAPELGLEIGNRWRAGDQSWWGP